MIDLLKKAKIFQDCTGKELEDIVQFCEKMSVRNGERIFDQENQANNLYIVSEGLVVLRFKVSYFDVIKEITLDRKINDETFGWSSVAMSPSHSYTLSAEAAKDSVLIRIDAKDIIKLCEKNNHIGYVLMKNIAEIAAERFTFLQRILIDIIQQNLKDKER